jgi:hypothetical protein
MEAAIILVLLAGCMIAWYWHWWRDIRAKQRRLHDDSERAIRAADEEDGRRHRG